MAEVSLQLAPIAKSALVPGAAIQRVGSQTGVWRLNAGKPEFVPVRTGVTNLDGQVQVLDGLAEGDKVVVYSQKALSAGQRVQVVDALVSAKAAGGAKP